MYNFAEHAKYVKPKLTNKTYQTKFLKLMIWLKQSTPGSKVPLAMFCPLMRKTLDTMQHKCSCWNSNLFTHLENSVSVQTCKYQIWASRKHWLEKIFKYLYFTAQMYKVLASGKALDCLIWCLMTRSIRNWLICEHLTFVCYKQDTSFTYFTYFHINRM